MTMWTGSFSLLNRMCLFTIQDENTLSGKHDKQAVLYTFDYHIVYSRSYSVPVLYFNVYKPGNISYCLGLHASSGHGWGRYQTNRYEYLDMYANDYTKQVVYSGVM